MSDAENNPQASDHSPELSPDLLGAEALLARGDLPEKLKVRLTPKALAAALELAASDAAFRNLPLRLYIEGKGCDGFYYGVTFDRPTPDDVTFPQDGVDVVVDRQSLRFLLGATIDWVDDERGRGFLVDNPGHKRYRGKFYKRQAWQAALAPTAKT